MFILNQVTFFSRADDEEQTRLSLNCTQQALMQVVAFLSQHRQFYQKTEILSLEKVIKDILCYSAVLFDKFICKVLVQQIINYCLEQKHKVVMKACWALESLLKKGDGSGIQKCRYLSPFRLP